MGAVSNLLDSKGHDVLTVSPDATVQSTLERMAEISSSTALVMEGGKVVGVFSERDVIRTVVRDRKYTDSDKVRGVMSTELTFITPETKPKDCMQLMTHKRIRHLPVLRDGNLCGIVSIGDVVKYLIVEKDFQIRNLENSMNKPS